MKPREAAEVWSNVMNNPSVTCACVFLRQLMQLVVEAVKLLRSGVCTMCKLLVAYQKTARSGGWETWL